MISPVSVNRQYRCSKCNFEVKLYTARCRHCGEWNSAEEIFREDGEEGEKLLEPVCLVKIDKDTSEYRIKTNESGLDGVLGGGLIPGAVVLLSGDPGIGKSTLLLQAADAVGEPVLYINGEESALQTSMRANRLHIEPDNSNVLLLPEQNVERAITVAEKLAPAMLAVDSIQTLFSDEYDSVQGSVSQVKECTAQLVSFAKRSDVPIIVVGHVTKGGTIAGPKSMEHFVDVVMSFTEIDDTYRELKAGKNRFGSITKTARYVMGEHGLTCVG